MITYFKKNFFFTKKGKCTEKWYEKISVVASKSLEARRLERFRDKRRTRNFSFTLGIGAFENVYQKCTFNRCIQTSYREQSYFYFRISLKTKLAHACWKYGLKYPDIYLPWIPRFSKHFLPSKFGYWASRIFHSRDYHCSYIGWMLITLCAHLE